MTTAHSQGGPDEALARLAWLAGCWAAESGERGSGEMWSAAAGGTMLGISRTVKKQQTVAHEFMQIRSQPGGGLVFIALPSGQSETRFAMIALSASEVIFENATHDFPQRVIYRRTGPETALGRIEGMRHGVARGIDFPLRRASCPP